MAPLESNGNGHVVDVSELRLDLTITDHDVVSELRKFPLEDERNDYARSALKVGVFAIRQASGFIDSQTIREESDRLMLSLKDTLTHHTTGIATQVSTLLVRYFDPSDGELPQRLERLLRRDGELEGLLTRHLGGENSTLSATLEKHLGVNSPLLQVLSPDQRKGILASLQEAVGTLLAEHNRVVCGQFSLDDKSSPLSRLITEITEKNGLLRKDLSGDIETIRKEFSLDNSEGALARLVNLVNQANQEILSEFSSDNADSALMRMTTLLKATGDNIDARLSLDQDQSPLSRLRRELFKVVDELKQANEAFHKDVRVYLETSKVRRDEAARSTVHGLDFEQAVSAFVECESRRMNDLFEPTSDTSGAISRCKVGDCVITLGSETAVPGARIVFEAKEDKSYNLRCALDDLRKARENRLAAVGVFVWSKLAAPEGTEPLARWGRDIVVVWDAEDVLSDVNLKVAISLARLIVVQERAASERTATDISAMEYSIAAITRDIGVMDEIVTWATTVKNNGDRIVAKAVSFKQMIENQLGQLAKHVDGLRSDVTV